MFLRYGMIIVAIHVFIASLCSQELHERVPLKAPCPPVAIQLTAKLPDGRPFGSLRATDVQVFFRDGGTQIISLDSFSGLDSSLGTTNILFVIPPVSDTSVEVEIHSILSTLARSDAFRFRAAVLNQHGTLSSFTNDIAELQTDFFTTKAKRISSFSEWVKAEADAYVVLHHQIGRRVIVRLTRMRHPERFHANVQFASENSMDSLATLDGTQVYRLLEPLSISSIIPFGDASTEPENGFGSAGSRQLEQVQSTADLQSTLWASRAMWNVQTNGRAEETGKALLDDLIQDNSSTYLLVAKPSFACSDAAKFRQVQITTRFKDVLLFAPSAIQMIPFDADGWPIHRGCVATSGEQDCSRDFDVQ